MKRTLLQVVCDYSSGGLEFGEIVNQLDCYIEDTSNLTIHTTSTPALDTIAIGFVTYQYALTQNENKIVIYGNAAPRKESKKSRKDNVGNGIKYAKLKNGVEIINVWSEYAFGFVKDQISEFRDINCPNLGSQFRSRDFFPKVVAEIVNGQYSSLTEKLDIENIPDIPSNLVAWTDWFGNIKTTMRLSDLKKQGINPGDRLEIRLNGLSQVGMVGIGGFSVEQGELAVSAGSSGFNDPFVELFRRVKSTKDLSAADLFKFPKGGEVFSLRKI